MNKTALRFMRWWRERNPSMDDWIIREECREIWDRWGEKVIEKSLRNSTCTSKSNFKKLLKYYYEKNK